MSDREQALAAYERAWERADEPEIRAELERCITPESTHLSPLSGVVRGVEGLVNLILDFPVMFPDAQLRVTGKAGIHHDKTFFTWQLTSTTRIRLMGQDYGKSLDGVDFVEFSAEGTISRITSFFGIENPMSLSERADQARRDGYQPPRRRTPPLAVDASEVTSLRGTATPQCH